jgi:hypothetical protein
MSIWQKEYYVSYVMTIKTKPMKIRANDDDEALDKLKTIMQEGHMEEEERETNYKVLNVQKKY